MLNIVTTDRNIEILKCKCMGDYYKYLCKLTPQIWAVVVYDDTDDNQIWECVYWTYKDALYAFNHYNKDFNR